MCLYSKKRGGKDSGKRRNTAEAVGYVQVNTQDANWITSSQFCAALQVYSSSSSDCIYVSVDFFLLKEATEFGEGKKKRGRSQCNGM